MDTDTTDAFMGSRDVAWKRDYLGQQVIQEFDTQRRLGRTNEVTQLEKARLQWREESDFYRLSLLQPD